MSHFLGKGWAMGTKFSFKPKIPLEKILVNNTHYQSYKLKDRLFKAGLKTPSCELCG
jgi:hypothetical protein